LFTCVGRHFADTSPRALSKLSTASVGREEVASKMESTVLDSREISLIGAAEEEEPCIGSTE
jgi:hypothetical protein